MDMNDKGETYPWPGNDPYDVVDPVLMPWARTHNINVATRDRDYHVRSIWVYGESGSAQIWLGWPVSNHKVDVFAAELDLSSPTKWRRREQRSVTLGDLERALDEIHLIVFDWVGPGAHSA